jgi:hypothetical protein
LGIIFAGAKGVLKNTYKPLGGFITWGFIFGLFFSSTVMGMTVDEKLEIAKSRCTPPRSFDPILDASTFSGKFTEAQMKELYEDVYQRPERLLNRVGYEVDGRFISKNLDKPEEQTVFGERLIKGVILQVEEILKRDHARYVFFPDLGHSHFFIPLDYYDTQMKGRRLQINEALTVAMQSEGLKVLYHVAEKLIMTDENKKVLPDVDAQWRFHTRNPTGDLEGNIKILKDFSTEGANTARNLEGYRYYSGFNISANENGCFPFETKTGEINYFDLSAWDLPYASSSNVGYFSRPNVQF